MSAAFWIVALLAAALLFLALEIFILTGVGLAGGIGVLLLLAGTTMAFMEYGIAGGMLVSLFSIGMVAAAVIVLMKTRVGRALIHQESVEEDEAPRRAGRQDLLDKHGRALTPLRPAGIVRIRDEEIDVVTQGEYIEAGAEVRVIEVRGTRIVVNEVST